MRRSTKLVLATAGIGSALLLIDVAFLGITRALLRAPGRVLFLGAVGAISLPVLAFVLNSFADRSREMRTVYFDPKTGREVGSGPWRYAGLSSPLARGEGCGCYPALFLIGMVAGLVYAAKESAPGPLRSDEIPIALQGHWRIDGDLGPRWPGMHDLYFSHERFPSGVTRHRLTLSTAGDSTSEVLTVELEHAPQDRPAFHFRDGGPEQPAALPQHADEPEATQFVSYAILHKPEKIRFRLGPDRVTWKIAAPRDDFLSRKARIMDRLEITSVLAGAATGQEPLRYLAMEYVDDHEYPPSIRELRRLSSHDLRPEELHRCLHLLASHIEDGFGKDESADIMLHARTGKVYEDREWWLPIRVAGQRFVIRIKVGPWKKEDRPTESETPPQVLRVFVELWLPPTLAGPLDEYFERGRRTNREVRTDRAD